MEVTRTPSNTLKNIHLPQSSKASLHSLQNVLDENIYANVIPHVSTLQKNVSNLQFPQSHYNASMH